MTESREQREHLLLRFAKAASIIVVAAVLAGLVYGYADYWRQFTGDTRFKRELAEERIQKDSLHAAKRRFAIGAGFGGCLGLAYVLRACVKRQTL